MKIRDKSQLSLFMASAHDNADRAPLRVWIDPRERRADNFAGGGGAKLGIVAAEEELGIERDLEVEDVAVNHWPEALAMYRANHPRCRVVCEDIVKVDPVAMSGGRRYALAWFSPTCIFFSQAKGGPLDESATKVRAVIDRVVAEHPEAAPAVLLDLVNAAYPFGERAYHPYKVWRKAMRALELRLVPEGSPLQRPCGACGAARGRRCRELINPRTAGEDPAWPIGSPRPMLAEGQFHETRTQPTSGPLFDEDQCPDGPWCGCPDRMGAPGVDPDVES